MNQESKWLSGDKVLHKKEGTQHKAYCAKTKTAYHMPTWHCPVTSGLGGAPPGSCCHVQSTDKESEAQQATRATQLASGRVEITPSLEPANTFLVLCFSKVP